MKKIIGLILTGLLCFIIWATIGSGIENIKIDLEVANFIKSATLIPEKSTEKTKYYEVKADFVLDKPTTTQVGSKNYPGYMGDIICTREAAIDFPVIKQGIEYYVGGHAAFCAFPYQSNEVNFSAGDTYEITGFGNDITANVQSAYYFLNGGYKEFMVYRVKTSFTNRFRAFINGLNFYGQSYNYSFIANKSSKKYCSDLVSASYKYVGIDLDPDGVATTVTDLMANLQVFLTYYSNVDASGVRSIYVLV